MRGVREGVLGAVGAVLAVVLVAGCGSRWTHPTKSQDEYHQDVYACEKDAAESRLKDFSANRFYNACMRAKGWRD